ncbi:MAG TPA: DUF2268 domain-containing putative Zn-dependent protease [Sphingobacteriaceae bacterium]
MKKSVLLILLLAGSLLADAADIDKGTVKPRTPVAVTKLHRGDTHSYSVSFKKGNRYIFSVMQNGIDLVVTLLDPDGKTVAEKDSPNGKNGFEKLSYTVSREGVYRYQVKALDDSTNTEFGSYDAYLAEQDKELQQRLDKENRKTVQTLDIDHFWEAYDNLRNCHTRLDSIMSFQTLYIDRATEGLEDFIGARGFSSSEYVRVIKTFPKFYSSVRANTLEARNAGPLIEDVFRNFKKIYPAFKPVKVNFAIGALRTAGTVSNRYVLIGTEMTTSTDKTDLSEIKSPALATILANKGEIVQSLKNIIAHESVHTQQLSELAPEAERCQLMYAIMMEGFCDFIGEKIAGGKINEAVHRYGNAHENELWTQLASNPCNGRFEDWLYNFMQVKDTPADLGYYMGYKIAESYYLRAEDKKQAIADIITMNDPKKFLEKSGYAEKFQKTP